VLGTGALYEAGATPLGVAATCTGGCGAAIGAGATGVNGAGSAGAVGSKRSAPPSAGIATAGSVDCAIARDGGAGLFGTAATGGALAGTAARRGLVHARFVSADGICGAAAAASMAPFVAAALLCITGSGSPG
jgi:hypothetical protein